MGARIIATIELPETASAYWFKTTLANGKTITISVPKD